MTEPRTKNEDSANICTMYKLKTLRKFWHFFDGIYYVIWTFRGGTVKKRHPIDYQEFDWALQNIIIQIFEVANSFACSRAVAQLTNLVVNSSAQAQVHSFPT